MKPMSRGAVTARLSSWCAVFLAVVAADSSCGPTCEGSCFEGHCLFQAGGGAAAWEDAPSTAVASASAAGLTSPAVGGEALQRTSADSATAAAADRQVALAAEASKFSLPVATAASEGASWASALAAPVSGAADPGPADEAGSTSVGALRARLGAAEAAILQLARENGALRQELITWHRAGGHIADREERLKVLLQQSSVAHTLLAPAIPSSETGQLLQKKKLTQEAAASKADAGADGFELAHTRQSFMLSLEIFAVLVIACNLYQLRGWFAARWNGSKHEYVLGSELKRSPAGAYGAWGQSAERLGRKLGVSDYVVEISEMQIANIQRLTLLGKVYITVTVGDREAAQSQQVWPHALAGSTALTFAEVFQVTIHRSDAPCLISIYDKDESTVELIAQTQIPAREFISMAEKRQEYHRLELAVAPHRRGAAAPTEAQQPFIALRLRDASARGAYVFCAEAAAAGRV